MDNQSQCFDLLEKTLLGEISVLSGLYACQKRMYECVLVRSWVQLQKEMAVSEVYADKFASLEQKRHELVQSICPGTEGAKDFYSVTANLDTENRARINDLFREMKRLLLLSKTENDVFNTYITNARAVISGMLETVLPGRHNKIYTRRGALASVNVDSLVLNRSF